VATVSICNLQVFFIKYYTEISHIVYKGNVPPSQYKMGLDRSRLMGEVNGLSLIPLIFMIWHSHHDSVEV
jgi:hypothetical protein